MAADKEAGLAAAFRPAYAPAARLDNELKLRWTDSKLAIPQAGNVRREDQAHCS